MKKLKFLLTLSLIILLVPFLTLFAIFPLFHHEIDYILGVNGLATVLTLLFAITLPKKIGWNLCVLLLFIVTAFRISLHILSLRMALLASHNAELFGNFLMSDNPVLNSVIFFCIISTFISVIFFYLKKIKSLKIKWSEFESNKLNFSQKEHNDHKKLITLNKLANFMFLELIISVIISFTIIFYGFYIGIDIYWLSPLQAFMEFSQIGFGDAYVFLPLSFFTAFSVYVLTSAINSNHSIIIRKNLFSFYLSFMMLLLLIGSEVLPIQMKNALLIVSILLGTLSFYLDRKMKICQNDKIII